MRRPRPRWPKGLHKPRKSATKRSPKRTFVAKHRADIIVAFDKCCGLAFEATAEGVEVRALYPSQAAASAAAIYIRTLRAMAVLAGELPDAA